MQMQVNLAGPLTALELDVLRLIVASHEAPALTATEPEKPKPEKPEPGKPRPEKPKPEKPRPEKPEPEEPEPEEPKPEDDPKALEAARAEATRVAKRYIADARVQELRDILDGLGFDRVSDLKTRADIDLFLEKASDA